MTEKLATTSSLITPNSSTTLHKATSQWALTTLEFYRNTQSIEQFRYVRPKSLASFREAAGQAVDNAEMQLFMITCDYLKVNISATLPSAAAIKEQITAANEAFIRQEMFSFDRIMPVAALTEVARKFDFDLMCERAQYMGQKDNLYADHIVAVRDLERHLQASLPPSNTSFVAVIDHIELVTDYMEKYCLSFYHGERMLDDVALKRDVTPPPHLHTSRRENTLASMDLHGRTSHMKNLLTCPHPYLETVFNYHQKRKQIREEIKVNLRKIYELPAKFSGPIGITMDDFSINSNHLARRAKCQSMPFFMLFPECCERLNECFTMMRDWLIQDREYEQALFNDLKNMMKEEASLKSQNRKIFEKMMKNRHSLDTVKRKHADQKELVLALHVKKFNIEDEYEKSEVALRLCEMRIDKARMRLKDLAQKEDEYSQEDMFQMRTELNNSIIYARKQLPDLRNQFDRLGAKLAWLREQMAHLKKLETEMSQLESDVADEQAQMNDLAGRLDKLAGFQQVIRNCHALKTSDSTMKKIFHNLQFENRMDFLVNQKTRRAQLPEYRDFAQTKDSLQIAIRIAAKSIELDWKKLYFNLPFYPKRGLNDVENDVDRIDKKYIRGLRKDLALESLHNWRRLHIRANVNCLIKTLYSIDRRDIAENILRRLFPPSKANKTNEMETLLPMLSKLNNTKDQRLSIERSKTFI